MWQTEPITLLSMWYRAKITSVPDVVLAAFVREGNLRITFSRWTGIGSLDHSRAWKQHSHITNRIEIRAQVTPSPEQYASVGITIVLRKGLHSFIYFKKNKQLANGPHTSDASIYIVTTTVLLIFSIILVASQCGREREQTCLLLSLYLYSNLSN